MSNPSTLPLPPKSGFNYSNKFARIYLQALSEVLKGDELRAVLAAAGLPRLAEHSLPDNLEKSFDFSYFSAIQSALETTFGADEGDVIAAESGRAAFPLGLRNFGDRAGMSDLAVKTIPQEDKLMLGLDGMAWVMNEFSDQLSRVYAYDEERTIYTLERCPMCWGRVANRPVCHAGGGLLEAGLSWLFDGAALRVEMAACVAQGDLMGKYVIYKTPLENEL